MGQRLQHADLLRGLAEHPLGGHGSGGARRRHWTSPIVHHRDTDGCLQFKLLLILAIINSGQNIVTPLVMTRGGPGYATYTVSYYMYESAVDYGEFGYSMAIALMLFVVLIGLTALSQLINRD